jgi:uncharacterized membrane protein YhdT
LTAASRKPCGKKKEAYERRYTCKRPVSRQQNGIAIIIGMVLRIGDVMTYSEKFAQMNREAAATGIAAALIAAFWWVSGFALERINFTVFYMPGWFVVSCAGSLILSIFAAVFLVKKVYKNFSFTDDEDADKT